MTDQPKQNAIVSQRDREVLEAIDDALVFLMDDERAILLDAFATYRAEIEAATIERCVGVADSNRTDDDSMWDRAADTIATAIRNLKGQTS